MSSHVGPPPTDELTLLASIDNARWERFRNFAGPAFRETIDEAEELRAAFARHVQNMLTSAAGPELAESASWVAAHAAEVAHRGAVVRSMYARFLQVDFGPVVCHVTR